MLSSRQQKKSLEKASILPTIWVEMHPLAEWPMLSLQNSKTILYVIKPDSGENGTWGVWGLPTLYIISFLLYFFSELQPVFEFRIWRKDLIFRSCCFLIKHAHESCLCVWEGWYWFAEKENHWNVLHRMEEDSLELIDYVDITISCASKTIRDFIKPLAQVGTMYIPLK